MKDLAVVILNWNGVNFLKQFLGKVTQYSGDARIIVADNNSTDNSLEYLEKEFPEVEIIRNSENGGFAKGYNDALKQVDAKYYLLLNSDVEVTPNWLVPMYQLMQDETIAGCQPKVLSYNAKEHFEHAGASGGFMDKNYFPFCRGRLFDHLEKDNGQYNDPREIFWVTGAAMLIRAEDFHHVNGFDEDFFAHMEEIDLCWRLKKQNRRFMVVPESVVYHVGGGTLPYSSPRKTYLNFRNSLKMIIKNHNGWLFPKLFQRMTIDGLAAMRFLAGGKFSHFWAVFKAHMYMYGHLGKFLKKRREIKKESTTFNAAGWYGGNILWNYYAKGVKEFSRLNQRLFR